MLSSVLAILTWDGTDLDLVLLAGPTLLNGLGMLENFGSVQDSSLFVVVNMTKYGLNSI